MGRNGVKTGTIYIKLYMSIFIKPNFSHPPKVFLNFICGMNQKLGHLRLGDFSVVVARYYKNSP